MRHSLIALVAFATLAAIPVACGSSSNDLFSSEAAGSGAASTQSTASAPTSATGSGNGGAAGGAATGTGGDTGEGGGLPEHCLNGVDDNQDGLVDCADPKCKKGFVCESAPSPWIGPVILFEGPPGSSPKCPNDYPTMAAIAFTNVQGDAATCEACTCTSPQATCTPAALAKYFDGVCTVQDGGNQQQQAACQGLSNGGAQNFTANAPSLLQSGGCSAVGGAPKAPPIHYDTEAIVCGGPPKTGAGCDNGACVPRPPASFEQSVCVFQLADASCPSEYPNKHAYAGSYDDTRGCTTCSCGAPGMATCTAKTSFFTDSSCAAADGSMPNDGTCHSVSQSAKSFKVETTLVNPGCAPAGGEPTGSVTPSQPVTVCCH